VRRLTILFSLFCLARPALAEEYDAFIDIETQDDLDELRNTEVIDDEAYEALSALLEEGVDLSKASVEEIYALPNLSRAEAVAIVDYRRRAGLVDPLELVANSILSQEKVLAIAPFLRFDRPDGGGRRPKGPIVGRAFLTSTYVVDGTPDFVPILGWAKARVGLPWSFGFLGRVTHAEHGAPVYDPSRDALSMTQPGIGADVPKFFAQYDDGKLVVLAGTYRLGFGQRLTLDTTGIPSPSGARPDLQFYYRRDLSSLCRESPGELLAPACESDRFGIGDLTVREGFRGVAIGARGLDIGPGWFELWAFGSLQTRSVYQYELFRPDRCDDPRADELEECKSPRVFATQDNPADPSSTFNYTTLPEMWNELLGGGHASFYWGARQKVGVTGWGAKAVWLPRGIELDFQETASTPGGGGYGAIGADLAYGWEWLDVYAEVTRSFDDEPGGLGGGYGAVARATASWGRSELELSGRYYDEGFGNPYARSIAQADELEGNRARDEAGGRIKVATAIGTRLRTRLTADLWQRLRAEVWRLRLYGRGDVKILRGLEASGWVEYADQGLDEGGRDECYSGGDDGTGDGDFGATPGDLPEPTDEDVIIEGLALCKGMKVKAAAEVRARPIPQLGLKLGGHHVWVDGLGGDMPTTFQRDLSWWAGATFRATRDLGLVARMRYAWEGTNSPTPKEQTLWGTAAVAWREPTTRILGSLRYDLRIWLDDRESTDLRSPNPEHWLRLTLEGRF
jgi:hypothetical protein